MHSSIIIIAAAFAALSPLVAAHGKIAVATGDAGGNTTALGIMGGIVPGAGRNKVTETDTTVFKKVNAATDGLGKTTGNGANTVDMMSAVVAQSGSTLPQVSSSGGTISATYHIVTTDGAGPVRAIVDPTGTGAFSSGTEMDVTTQPPGNNGNIAPGASANPFGKRWISRMLGKRAANVNTDHPMAVAVPAGTTCTGSMGGMSNVCLMKIANSNPAGPFGGVIAFQVAGSGSNSAASTAGTASTGSTAASTSTESTGTSADSTGASADESEE